MPDFMADFLLAVLAVLGRVAISAIGVASGLLAGGYRRLFSNRHQEASCPAERSSTSSSPRPTSPSSASSASPSSSAIPSYRELRDGGRALYPVNRSEGTPTVEGDLAYRRLADVPDPVDGVVVMVPHGAEAEVVGEAIARGIPRIWVHRVKGRDPVSDEIRSMCQAAGARLVDGACPLMFLEPVRGLRRLHRNMAR